MVGLPKENLPPYLGKKIYFISSAVLQLLLHFLPEQRGRLVMRSSADSTHAVCTEEVLSQQLHLYLLQFWKTKIFALLED